MTENTYGNRIASALIKKQDSGRAGFYQKGDLERLGLIESKNTKKHLAKARAKAIRVALRKKLEEVNEEINEEVKRLIRAEADSPTGEFYFFEQAQSKRRLADLFVERENLRDSARIKSIIDTHDNTVSLVGQEASEKEGSE